MAGEGDDKQDFTDHIVRKRTDKKSFMTMWIGKLALKSFEKQVVRNGGEEKNFSDHMIRERGCEKALFDHMIKGSAEEVLKTNWLGKVLCSLCIFSVVV
jgi:hypothetical protein